MKHSRITAMSTLGENSAGENGWVARPRMTSRQVSRLACGISKRAGVATSTSPRSRRGWASAKSIATAPPRARPTRTKGRSVNASANAVMKRTWACQIGQPIGAAGASVTGQIERHRRVVRLEVRQLVMPGVGVGAGAVQEHQQLAAIERRRHVRKRGRAGVEIVDRDATDVDVLGEHADWWRYTPAVIAVNPGGRRAVGAGAGRGHRGAGGERIL